jgi:hypothetical protein
METLPRDAKLLGCVPVVKGNRLKKRSVVDNYQLTRFWKGEQVSRSFTDHRRYSIWTTAPRGNAVYELEGWN